MTEQSELCNQFATVTNTDEALAQYFLSENDWDLQSALENYFTNNDPSQENEVVVLEEENAGEESVIFLGAIDKNEEVETDGGDGVSAATNSQSHGVVSDGQTADSEPKQIRLITWNIDGLHEENLLERTREACHVLQSHSPDVVYLQEVVPETFAVIAQRFRATYHVFQGDKMGYFTMMMIKKATVALQTLEIAEYPCTTMSRNLMMAKAKAHGLNLHLYTSHNESTKNGSAVRKEQLQMVFESMRKAGEDVAAVFGGDTNARDREIISLRCHMFGIKDVWETLGAPLETKFTWDLEKNDNLVMGSNIKPRCRFDRVYLKQSSTGPKLVPQTFEFVGTHRLTSCDQFISDHWGLKCDFHVVP